MSKKIAEKLFFNKNLIILLIFLLFLINFYYFFNIKVYSLLDFKYSINTNINNFCEDNEVKTNIQNRTVGSNGEKEMAYLLEDYLEGFDYYNNTTSYLHEFNISNGKTSNNIIGVIDNSAEKYVIIGAHYDNVYVSGKSYGFNDNISGVVAVQVLANFLKAETLNYNVIVAFFGAEEIGCVGSLNFAKNLPTEIRENILLYINFDSIGQGDNIYYYTTDNPTKYGNTIDKVFKTDEHMTKYANECYSTKASNGLNYTNLPLLSDNSSFLKQQINALSFFAGNLNTTNGLGYFETQNHDKIMHNTDSKATSDAVFDDGYINNINSVLLSTVKLLKSSDFTAENFAPNQVQTWAFSDWVIKGVGVIFTGLMFGGYLIFYKFKKS